MASSPSLDFLRTKAVWYLQKWIGTPYKYGGDDFSGFDCGGLMHEVLQAVGIEKRGFDSTAHGLYVHFKDKKKDKPARGCLAFLLRDGKARHVGMMFDEYFVIHAGGGDFETHTVEDAIRKNAYVKMDRISYWGSGVKFTDPFLEETDWSPGDD